MIEGLDLVAVNHHIGHILAEEHPSPANAISYHRVSRDDGAFKHSAQMYTRHCIILDRTVLDIESTLTLVAQAVIGSVDEFAMYNSMIIRVLIVGNAVDLTWPVGVKVNAGIGPLHGLVSHTIVGRPFNLAVTI